MSSPFNSDQADKGYEQSEGTPEVDAVPASPHRVVHRRSRSVDEGSLHASTETLHSDNGRLDNEFAEGIPQRRASADVTVTPFGLDGLATGDVVEALELTTVHSKRRSGSGWMARRNGRDFGEADSESGAENGELASSGRSTCVAPSSPARRWSRRATQVLHLDTTNTPPPSPSPPRMSPPSSSPTSTGDPLPRHPPLSLLSEATDAPSAPSTTRTSSSSPPPPPTDPSQPSCNALSTSPPPSSRRSSALSKALGLTPSSRAHRLAAKNAKFQAKFRLPADQVLLLDFTASLNKSGLLHTGRLLASSSYLCFYSSIFGMRTTEKIAWRDVRAIRKNATVGIGGAFSVEVSTGGADCVSYQFVMLGLDIDADIALISSVWRGVPNMRRSRAASFRSSKQSAIIGSEVISRNEAPRGAVESEDETEISKGDDEEELHDGSHDDDDDDEHDHDHDHDVSNDDDDDDMGLGSDDDDDDDLLTGTETSTDDGPSPRGDGAVLSQRAYVSHDFLHTGDRDRNTVADMVLPVTPVEFFCLFYGNDATFTRRFRAARGETDLNIGPWTPHAELENVRDVHWVTPVNAIIGPPTSRLQETQRYHLTESLLTVETVSITPDVPYGDCFYVESRWIVELIPAAPGTPPTSRVSVTAGVHFIKSVTLFKSRITNGALTEYEASLVTWTQLAHTAIAEMRAKEGASDSEGLSST
eukprot:CAMPEP_0170753312 /NCGR_PEP_ID=MMETSP0437-20130122/12427_1 /TAXON_ID=0 /ORGANISM="Sexangularia sp." /LENGTH=700 /DNA_ID=CAMNT_0011092425 /DNA_START=28 /DNA_END=2126 /DNA_ORIENTATION=-